jgi:hypothetical protein
MHFKSVLRLQTEDYVMVFLTVGLLDVPPSCPAAY